MDVLERLGGRKFVFALIILLAGVVSNAAAPSGINAEMTAFLIGILATFSGANVWATIKAPGSQDVAPKVSALTVPEGAVADGPPHEMVDDIMLAQLDSKLNTLGNGQDQLKDLSIQIGQGMVQLTQLVATLKK